MFSQIERGGAHLERLAGDKSRAPSRESAFTGFTIAGEEIFRDHELENGIAQKFEALVVELHPSTFMRHARMSEGFCQESRILKSITNSFFQRVHGSVR
jgi:hypothetical protein